MRPINTRGGPGPTRGERRRRPRYDPRSGESWKVSADLEPATAAKLYRLCDVLELSASAAVDLMIARLAIDPETGRPVGWPDEPVQEEVFSEAV